MKGLAEIVERETHSKTFQGTAFLLEHVQEQDDESECESKAKGQNGKVYYGSREFIEIVASIIKAYVQPFVRLRDSIFLGGDIENGAEK